MQSNSTKGPVAAVSLAALLCAPGAMAQFGTPFPGFVQLPAEDFTWVWGETDEEAIRRPSPEFQTTGNESGFRCELTGRFRPGRQFTHNEVREMERNLSSSLAFIQAAAQSMTILDRNFDLDWAILDCDKQGDEPLSEEQAQKALDRALEKAIRQRERRRERNPDDD
jgi:hypothetical protein